MKTLVLLAACVCWLQSQSQQVNNPVQLGDQYFAAGEYYTAAHLYGQYLHPSKKQSSSTGFPLNSRRNGSASAGKNVSRTDILFKQAESYRLANYWQDAATAYKECAEKDPAKYSAGLYWAGVSERSLGNYAAAEENLKKYLSAADNSQYKEAAEKELQTLKYIQQQLTRADSVLVKLHKVDAPNSNDKGVYAPVHVSGDQFLFSSTEADAAQVDGVNPNHSRLFTATLTNGSITAMEPVALPAAGLNNQGAAAISTDGKHLYISQWKKEKGRTVSTIYHSVKEGSGWSSPVLLPSVSIAGSNSKQPFCSADGKYLFFSSDRPGGSGGFDIWYATLNSDGTAGEPVNVGSVINTKNDEQAPFYHITSGTLVFSSSGRVGMGGYDLYSAKGSEANWSMPENLGHPINSSRDDIYFYSNEKGALLNNAIFSSDRGAGCCLETYRVSKESKSTQLAGVLMDCNISIPVANAEVVLKDASGKIWKTNTDAYGKYSLDIGGIEYKSMTLTVTKDGYVESTPGFQIANADESDLLVSRLKISDACIAKVPEQKLVIKVEDVVTVYFDYDKSALKPPTLQKLDSIYNVMTEFPAATIQISGYTDGRGTEQYNAVLSDKRARACADYLIKKGINKARITFVSFGACCPVEMELLNGLDNAEGRSKNRRALINVKKE